MSEKRMFLIHLDSYVPKEQFTKGYKQQGENLQRQDWKLGLLNFRVSHSGLTLKKFFHKLVSSQEHSAAQSIEPLWPLYKVRVMLVPD